MRTKKGCVRKVLDDSIKLSSIEILSENTSDSYIYTAPGKYNSLAISLPILVLIVKNVIFICSHLFAIFLYFLHIIYAMKILLHNYHQVTICGYEIYVHA